MIDKIASEPDDLSIMSKKFKTCRPLNNSSELKDYLAGIYMAAAQYNAPPYYPVTRVCKALMSLPWEITFWVEYLPALLLIKENSHVMLTNPPKKRKPM